MEVPTPIPPQPSSAHPRQQPPPMGSSRARTKHDEETRDLTGDFGRTFANLRGTRFQVFIDHAQLSAQFFGMGEGAEDRYYKRIFRSGCLFDERYSTCGYSQDEDDDFNWEQVNILTKPTSDPWMPSDNTCVPSFALYGESLLQIQSLQDPQDPDNGEGQGDKDDPTPIVVKRPIVAHQRKGAYVCWAAKDSEVSRGCNLLHPALQELADPGLVSENDEIHQIQKEDREDVDDEVAKSDVVHPIQREKGEDVDSQEHQQ